MWLGSYISAREQQVIIKNAISGKGNLKAGVLQGSTRGPLLFLVFINDIADETISLIVFMWFDHLQSALKVIPKCLRHFTG
jgi:hypothetical protein